MVQQKARLRLDLQELIWAFFFFFSFLIAPVLEISHYLMTIFILFASVFYGKGGKIRFSRKLKSTLSYFGLFFLYMTVSAAWSGVSIFDHRGIIIAFAEGFLVILAALNYMTDSERLFKFIRSFIYAMSALALLYYFTSPISTWGTEGMGRWLGLWRNSLAYYAGFAAICAIYLYYTKLYYSKRMLWLGLFLIAAAVGTGSRKIFLLFAVALLVYLFLQPGVKKKMKFLFWGIAAVVAALIIGMKIPAIRSIYEGRLMAVFQGIQSSDSSTVVRAMMRQYAMALFAQNPIVGIGLDGFKYWMETQPGFMSRWAMSATYSHCNYTELLCNGGLIGFGLFYWYPVKQVVKSLKHKNNLLVKLGIILIVSFIALDYGTVSYYTKMCMYILMLGIVCIHLAKD